MTRSRGFDVDRRSVLRGAVAGSALLAGPGLARAGTLPRQSIRFVVIDERIDESKAFGAALQWVGAQHLEVTSGLTAIWKDHLRPHWQNSQGAAVGLTTRRVWDGLSQQAHGQFRKARLVGLHQRGTAIHQYQHRIETSLGAGLKNPGQLLASNQWPVEIARILARYPIGSGSATVPTFHGTAIPAEHLRQQLVSWIVE